MNALEPRYVAAVFLAAVLLGICLLCLWLTHRSARPAVVWGSCGYWALLHVVALAGLLTSTQFETAIAPITLLTFPFSALVAENHWLPGFATLPGLAANYVRYVVWYGGLNTLLVWWFLAAVLPRPAGLRTKPSGLRH